MFVYMYVDLNEAMERCLIGIWSMLMDKKSEKSKF